MPSSSISLCPSSGSLLIRYGDYDTLVMGQRTNGSRLTSALLVTAGAGRAAPEVIADPFNEGDSYHESVTYFAVRLPLTGANVAALRATDFGWTAEADTAAGRFLISEPVVQRIAVASERLDRRQESLMRGGALFRPSSGAAQPNRFWEEELVDEMVDWRVREPPADANTKRALLSHVIEHPADDTARLVYADWLEENGDGNRAEFIRLQIERACLAEGDPRGPGLEQREGELLGTHRETWSEYLSEFRQPIEAFVHSWTFHRGFIEFVSVDTQRSLVRALNVLAGRTPVPRFHIEWLTDTDGTAGGSRPYVLELASAPQLARVRCLDLTGHERILAPALAPDSFDVVHRNHLTAEFVRLLLASPHLTGLNALILRNTRFNDEAAQALANAPILSGLTALDLSENRIGPAGIAVLSCSPHLGNLTTLNLESNQIGNGGAEHLARSDRSARLTKLDLRGNGIGPRGLEAILGSPHLGGLTSLRLFGDCGRDSAHVPRDTLPDGGLVRRLRERFGDRIDLPPP